MAERASQSGQEKPGTLARLLPILQWAPQYERGWLRPDLIAGLTVALVLIPQSMAYAQLAGLPPVVGLYASMAPLVVYALFGTSRTLAVGPVAVVAAPALWTGLEYLRASLQPEDCSKTP